MKALAFSGSQRIGGVRPEKILHSLVRFENGTIGTIASSGTDLGKLSIEDLYVDIGAESREEAEKKVSVGDAAVYMGQPVQTGTTLFSPYLDDRLGCVILLKTMGAAADSPNVCTLSLRSRRKWDCAAPIRRHMGSPRITGIAVDVTCTDDVPGSRHTVSAALGKGAGIKVMDGSLMCHGAVVERLKELAAGHGIPAQPDLMSAGGTDAGPMHISHDGVLAGGISIPCRGDPFSGGDGGSWGCGRMHPPGCCLRVQQAGIARSKSVYVFAIISKESIEKMNLTIPFYPCIISSVFRALPEGKYGITQEEYK